MSSKILESYGATVPGRRQYKDPFSGINHSISATARSSKAHATAIRADMGEAEAYKEALYLRGESSKVYNPKPHEPIPNNSK
jgi:hypothetical protein